MFFIAYFEEQEKALEFIRESPDLKIDEKKRFFKAANTNLGESWLIVLHVLVSLIAHIRNNCFMPIRGRFFRILYVLHHHHTYP
jgi:hypothetical protein